MSISKKTSKHYQHHFVQKLKKTSVCRDFFMTIIASIIVTKRIFFLFVRTEQHQHQDLIEILSLCSKGLSVLSSKDFKLALNNLIETHQIVNKQNNVFIDYILDCIIKEWDSFHFQKVDFFKSNIRGEIVVARNIAIVLIKMHSKITYGELANYFGLSYKQAVHKIIKKHNDMDVNNKFDAQLLERYERLKIKVLNFINTLKNK